MVWGVGVAFTCDACGYSGGLEIVNGVIRCPRCHVSERTLDPSKRECKTCGHSATEHHAVLYTFGVRGAGPDHGCELCECKEFILKPKVER